MPPKKNVNLLLTILKFKRGNITVPLAINLDKSTLDQIKQQLAETLSAIGGIQQDIDIPIDEDDIKVPQSELMDENEDDSDEIEPEDSSKTRGVGDSSSTTVDPKDIEIAVPKDKSQPYAGEWIQLYAEGASLASLGFADYSILAFSVGNEPFSIEEAAYEE